MDVLLEWGDLLFLVNQAFFVLTFVVVAVRTVRERRRSDLDVAFLFGVMALLLVVSRLAAALDVPIEDRRVMVAPLILAVPYLMLRLVADFATVQWWALRLAEVAFAAQVVAFLVRGTIALAAVAAYAAVPIAWSSVAFVREAWRARTVTSRRYTAAALGNVAAVASLLVVVVAVPTGGGDIAPLSSVVLQLCVLAAGTSYFVAFATPSWLRRLWRDADLRSFLARAPALIALSDLDALVRELANGARAAMGSEGVLIGLSAGPGRLRFRGTGPDYDAPLDETFGGRAMRAGRALVSFDPSREVPLRAQMYRERNVKMLFAAPIRIGDEIIGALTARSSHASLFASDDLEMCQLLADQAAFVLKNRELIEQRQHQADHDGLTGLPNAGVLLRRVEQRVSAGAAPFALLLLDLDAFAEVNQTFGHVVGDQVLLQIAQRLSDLVPPASLLTRWSGDQFAFLLPNEVLRGAEGLADRILASFERPFAVGQEEIECGVSIGIALYPDHAADARGVLAATEMALGLAKRAANTYAVYPLEAHPLRTRRLALRADLRRAIGDGSLRLEYQPLVSLRSGGLLRLEALARWDHPERGAISPAEFVDLAERTGLIRSLTERVLHQALVDARAWRLWLPRLRVAVNLSARMFADAALIERITALCSRADCDPEGLSLEITESVLMTEPERAQHVIVRLRELGVTTEIDDFGTGYSSLAYLQRLPVTGIKIDHQFIAAMSRDERSDAIVRATIRLSHELGFEVVAEGIEDRELWDLLAASGCDVGQGFYVGRPMPAAAVRGWLSSWVRRAPAAPMPTVPEADRQRRLVLVVDDDPAIVSVMRDVLGEHGYAVATASDGGEALGVIATRKPDAVLLDVHMPLVDGAAFVGAVRDRGLDVPFVVMTAGSNAQRWAERLGASGFLAKPFAMEELLSVTARVTGGSSLALQ